ncbi:12702_t:CDS:2, partial [Gigaspora margarita]
AFEDAIYEATDNVLYEDLDSVLYKSIDSATYKSIYSSIYETTNDFLDKESDSSLKTFHTWDNAKNFLNRYGLEKGSKFIEFCVNHGVTSAQSIERLLKGKFPERKFNASDLMKHLYTKYAEEQQWFIETKFDEVELNNCNKTQLIATALLKDETENSFVWALSMIKKCMNRLTPKVLFTDSDPGMANAISLKFPDSLMHILYGSHIKKNLRNKLGPTEFRKFREDFFKCRNMLVPDTFETNNYIKRQLDPLKHKWAICYTNNQFTASANSIQRVECLNQKIHDCVWSNSSLLSLVKKIQDILDKESEYARVEEYNGQIPTVGLPTISKTYFSSIEKEQTSINYSEGAREDDCEITKIHLANIMSSIGQDQILEIWRVVISCGVKINYIILLSDGSHRCICNIIITHGYPYRHFYKVLHCSVQAKWHIGLIAAHWYKDNFTNDNDIWQQSPITLCINSDQYQSIIKHPIYKFDYIKQIRGAEVYSLLLQEVNSTRQKYGRGQDIMRKALDIAIATNLFDELMGICHGFILDKQERQPPGRAKSCVEIEDQPAKKNQCLEVEVNQITDKIDKNKDKRKTCQICELKGHNRVICKLAKG